MHVYFISGLGADRQAFQRLQLDKSHTSHHIDWIEPHPNETISHYAQRMSEAITHEVFVLVGLSFGGMIAIEINKIKPAQKVLLISSICCRKQLPWYLRFAGYLPLNQLRLLQLVRHFPFIRNWMFGATDGKLKNYLQERLASITDNYLYWSIQQILQWEQPSKPANVVQLHGTKDRMFPPDYIQADHWFPHGSHFMILTHASSISQTLNIILAPPNLLPESFSSLSTNQ
jgi:pimeloyl-ACP methyl ester carboxylesterase